MNPWESDPIEKSSTTPWLNDPIIKESSSESLLDTAYDVAESAAKGFNRGLAMGVGSFVDLINIPFGFETPVGGSKWFLEEYQKQGKVGGEKYPFVANVGEIVGTAAPFYGVTGAIARTAATGGKYGAPLLEAYRQAPTYNAAMELYSAGRAGVGYALAKELFPENSTAEVIGTVVGGMASPVAIAGPLVKRGVGGAKRAISTMLSGGAERSAARQIQKIVTTEPKVAARTLRMKPGGELTPAQELADPGLLRLQKAFESVDPTLAETVSARTAKAAVGLKEDYYAISKGEPQAAAEFFEKRIEYVTEQAERLSTKAILKAKAELEKLPKGVSRETESIAVRDAILSHTNDARVIEGKLWDDVDNTAQCVTDSLYDLYDGIKTAGYTDKNGRLIPPLAKAEQEDIPNIISRHLGENADKASKFQDTESLREIKAFRTKLLEAHRREASETVPDRKVLRILDDMQEKALEVMEASGASGPLQEARVFSRQLNQRFNEGVIGKIRGTARRGGPSVASEETLLHIIKDGPPGGVRYDQLMSAVENDPEAVKAVESYISRLFVKQATDVSGKIVPSASERFTKSFSELLDRMPTLKKQFKTAQSSQQLADRISKRMESRVKGLWDKNRSRAALYLGSSPQARIKNVLISKQPTENMRELVKMTRRDPSGNALKGLKAEVLDHIWQAGMDSATKMEGFFKKNLGPMNEVFTREEQQGILTVINQAKKLELSVSGGKSLKQILDETPDVIIDLLSRIVGANVGGMSAIGRSTGAPIVVAGAGSKFVRQLTNRIPMARTRDVLAEAVLDKAKMAMLLEKAPPGKEAEVFTRRLNAWLASIIPKDEQE
jgi:hypothetical protein